MALVESLYSEVVADPVTGDKVSFFLTYQTQNNQITRFRIVNDTDQDFWVRADDSSQGVNDEVTVSARSQESFNIPPGRYSYEVDGQGNLVMGDLVVSTRWPA